MAEKQLKYEFQIKDPLGTSTIKTGIGPNILAAAADAYNRMSTAGRRANAYLASGNEDVLTPLAKIVGQYVETKTLSAGSRQYGHEIIPVSEEPGRRITDNRSAEDIRLEGLRQTPTQIANLSQRAPGESITDFTKRLDAPLGSTERTNQLLGGEYFDPKTGAQIREFTPSSGSGTQTGGTSSGVASGGSQRASGSGSGYSPVVGTSFAERYKELQKELGLGKAPTAPDYFTSADKARLGTARDERTAIEAEMATILNERLAIDEELQKFGINAGEGTTEAGRIGAVSEAQRNANERLMVLNRRELVLETKLRSRNTVISELMGLQKEDYANAVEQYNTQFSRAMQLYAIFDEEQDEARADAKEAKNELKTSAKANLDVLSNAYQKQIESGQITQLSGMQRAKLEELETQAGLPIGSTMAVLSTLKPSEEKLWAGVDDFGNFKYIYRDTNGSIGVRTSPGAVPQKPTGTGESESDVDTYAEAYLNQEIDITSVPQGIRGKVLDRANELAEEALQNEEPVITEQPKSKSLADRLIENPFIDSLSRFLFR